MKKAIYIIFLCGIMMPDINAQDIADVGVKSRFAKSKGVYVAGGIGIVQGALGDYDRGLSFETGFMKRLNKVMSIGAGISYLKFDYKKEKTYPYYYNTDPTVDEIIILSLQGGDVSLVSAGFNFKLNLIPVSDNTVFSVYGIATPFVSYASRGEVSGNGVFYKQSTPGYYDVKDFDDPWTKNDFPILKQESKVTGGAYLGFGIELFPAKTVSGFLQATYGYTLPITYVNTTDYLHAEDIRHPDAAAPGRDYYGDNGSTKISYYNDQFPIVKKGFTALSIKLGVSINF